MNRYHLEVIKSNWPTRTVMAEILEVTESSYVFKIWSEKRNEWVASSAYPIEITIITDIEYDVVYDEI